MISVIIPTCNRSVLLSNCLDLLSLQVRSENFIDFEVIVTDDSIDDVTKCLIQTHYPWVKWYEGFKKGPATNRNNGAKHAVGEWLVFTDDDCLPQPNWLNVYLKAIQANSDVLVFEGATDADRPKERFDEEAPINLDGNKLWSCNFAIKSSFFNQLNGFDETFPYAAMEDIDFYVRVLNETKIMFLPQALVLHPWRRIKPFANFKKHLISHKHFAKKYGILGTFNFRWSRIKIFVGATFANFKELLFFSMKGWPVYFERFILNFCMIFL